ncbi:MAG: hypothetical protein ACRDQ5_06995 [Sciscionella sp.]
MAGINPWQDIIHSDNLIRMDNVVFRRVRALFAAVLVLSVAALGVAAAVGSSAAVWIRDSIVIVIAAVLIVLAARAYRGSRRAYLRMLLMSGIAPVAIAVIIAVPNDGFPVWMKLEQSVVGIMLLAVVTMLSRKTVRSAYPRTRATTGAAAG